MVAARPIHRGEIVAEEEPYAAVLLHEHEEWRCHHCFAPAVLFPCDNCAYARFCSIQCKQNANWYHAYECSHPLFAVAPTLLVLCLRILLHRWNEISLKSPNSSERQTWSNVNAVNSALGFTSDSKWNADYSSVCALMTHVDNLTYSVLEQYLFYCLVAFINLKHEPWMDVSLLFHHLCQTHTNVYAVYEISSIITDKNHRNESLRSGGVEMLNQTRVAEAIYPTCSLFNHSCRPNTVLNYNGRRLTIRASEEIRKGEQVFNCYGPHYARMPTSERQRLLQSQYFFLCKCDACTSDGKTEFNYLVCPVENCKEELQVNREALQQKNVQILWCNKCGMKIEMASLKKEIQLAKQFFERGEQSMNQDDLENALKCFQFSLNIRMKYLHPFHQELAKTFDAIARAYSAKRDFVNAAANCANSVRILERIYGFWTLEMGNEYFKLAQLYFNARKTREALEALERAESIISTLAASSPLLNEIKEMKKALQ
jgi:hypothetical protein